MTDPSEPTIAELVASLGNLSNRLIEYGQRNRELETKLAECEQQLAVSQGINRREPVTQEQLDAANTELDAARAEAARLTAQCDQLAALLAERDATIERHLLALTKAEQELDDLKAAAVGAITASQTAAAKPSVGQVQPGSFLGGVFHRQNPPRDTGQSREGQRAAKRAARGRNH